MWPPVEVSAPCRAREGELPCKGKRDRPEPRLSAPRTSAGRPVSGPYEKGGTASVYAVGAAHRAARPAFPLPGGRCPSAHTGADEGDPVEGKSDKGREKPPWGVPPPGCICKLCSDPLRQNRDKSVSQSRRSEGILPGTRVFYHVFPPATRPFPLHCRPFLPLTVVLWSNRPITFCLPFPPRLVFLR